MMELPTLGLLFEACLKQSCLASLLKKMLSLDYVLQRLHWSDKASALSLPFGDCA